MLALLDEVHWLHEQRRCVSRCAGRALERCGAATPICSAELFGKAFENWVHHELVAFRAHHAPSLELSYWRLASGIEVDFIVGQMQVAIEAKASTRITADHLSGLRHLHTDHPRVRRVVVCLEPKRRVTDDGIEIVPVRTFVTALGEFLGRL